MNKTPREILGVLTMNYTRNPGKECIDAALADLKEAILAAKPHSSMGWATERQIGYDKAANEFEQAILTMFEGE